MLDRISTLHALIAQQRQMNLQPVEMHANATTVSSFVAEAGLHPILPPDTRSIVARVRFPQDAPAPRYEFDGVRIVPNPKVQGGAIILRPQQLMGQEDWLERHIRYSEPQQLAMGQQETPWHQREVRSPDEAVDADKGVLEQLSNAGGVSVTDVILKSMEGLDEVSDVVVLRFHRNRDVSMCSTLNHFEIVGGLQKAMNYVLSQDR